MENSKKKTGSIKTNDVLLEPHEYETVKFLMDYGKHVELLVPSYTPKNRNPDFCMDGVLWEMKSPQGKEVRTIEHAFKNAARQSENIVIDLRRTKVETNSALKVLDMRFRLSRRTRRTIIITREEKMVDWRKK